MYDKKDKRRLYWLIDQYLVGKVDETSFCNDFHDSYVNEMCYNDLTDAEYKAFSDLSDVSQRFSEYEDDFKLWDGFVTAEQLKKKILEIKVMLKEQTGT